MKLSLPILIALLLGLAIPSTANANLITNGSFSTGDFTGWSIFTTADGTLGSTGFPAVTSFDVTGTGAQNAATFQVGQAILEIAPQNSGSLASITEGGGIFQQITTVAGSLNFNASIAAFTTLANVEGGIFSVLLDGVLEDQFAFGFVNTGQTRRNSLSFNNVSVGAGSHTIEISIARPFLSTQALDEFVTNVSATEVASAVPEPSTWAMMILGFLGLGFMSYRRKNQSMLVAA